MAPSDAKPSEHANTTLVLVGVLFTIILAGIDTTVVSTAMPVALKELGGAPLYAWTFAAYMLATAMSMPIWGPGSDRWGRKRTYLAGVAVFVVGSALAAAAPTMTFFIAARALQGIGAGAVSSLPFIVLGVVFPPEKRGKALGIVSSAWAISSVAGPLIGTAIVTHASWRWVFLVNLPVGLLAATLVARGMRESVGDRAGRFDSLGSALAGSGGAALIWAFVRLGEGARGLFEGALLAVGIALLAAFVAHESRAT
ncbi:MAG: MFS transporter, partial [Thermoplasmatota archaeon]